MKLTSIWQRYFLREVVKVFSLFIFSFYSLYILIDYSSRSSIYRSFHFSAFELAGYYVDIFVQRLEILIPFALLIATVRTLCQLNVRNELTALRASGIRLHTLLRPLLVFALFLTFFLYLNNQYFIPRAHKNLAHLEESHFKDRYKTEKRDDVRQVSLQDGSVLLYHRYDPEDKAFYDVYWIISFDHLYRMKYLYPYEELSRGTFVEEFKREDNGELLLTASKEEQLFPHLIISKKDVKNSSVDIGALSLTKLWKNLLSDQKRSKSEMARLRTAFSYKLMMPWLCLLVFIAPAPFCLRFNRMLPVFFIYIASMLATVAFYLAMHSAVILGESRVVDPLAAIGLPFAFAFVFFGWRYFCMR